jgi:Domain of unknown function (DUF4115)
MSVVPILGVFVLAGAIVAWVSWHRRTYERHSVEHHQQALETLRHVAVRAEHPAHPRSPGVAQKKANAAPGPSAPSSRPVGRVRTAAPPRPHAPASKGTATPARSGASSTARHGTTAGARNGARSVAHNGAPPAEASTTGRRRRPTPGRTPSAAHPTMVFVDDAAPPVAADGAGLGLGVVSEARVAPSRLVTRLVGTRRARRRTAAASGAAVVVFGVVLGVTLSSAPSARRPHAPLPTAGHAVARGRASSGADATGSGHPASISGTTDQSDGAPPGSPTTGPSSTAGSRTATAAQAHSASYVAPTSPYTVSISASGQCWVLAQEVGSGQVLWTGTLQAGNLRTFSGFGAVQLRLGAASDVTVSLNGTDLALPAGFQSPFDVNLAA